MRACVRVCVRACVCGYGHDLKMTLRPALRTVLTVDLNALDSSYKRHHSVSSGRAEAGRLFPLFFRQGLS